MIETVGLGFGDFDFILAYLIVTREERGQATLPNLPINYRRAVNQQPLLLDGVKDRLVFRLLRAQGL